VGIGERVRAVHLSQYCPGGLGFPAGSPGTGRADRGGTPSESWAELAGNEAQAAGRRCARCRREISAGQPARRRADHGWVHGDCRWVQGDCR
jgi:hypothetical protein